MSSLPPLCSHLTLAEVPWPEGTYGLLKAKTGCPVSLETKWTTGWRFQDTEDNNPGNQKSPSFHLDAAVGTDINRTFCMKVTNKETTPWPSGKLCIMTTTSRCRYDITRVAFNGPYPKLFKALENCPECTQSYVLGSQQIVISFVVEKNSDFPACLQ